MHKNMQLILAVTCPKCGATPGDECVTNATGFKTLPHHARRKLAATMGGSDD